MVGPVLLALAAVCLVLWLVFGHGFTRRVAGLPPGEVVYAGNEKQAKLLRAPQYNLLGKPDYVVRQGKEFIPVELKSGTAPKKLHDSDRMQVIAQALLVEAEYGTRPPFAFVQYPGRTYKVNVRPQSIARLGARPKSHSVANATIVPGLKNQGVTRSPVCRGAASNGVFGRTPRGRALGHA